MISVEPRQTAGPHERRDMTAITNNINGVAGKFACVYGGIRTEEFSHGDESKAFGGVIADNPADVTGWLVLADRLEEEGNPAHHMIRVLFTPGYEPPVGFRGEIIRGGNVFENGGTYREGPMISWGEDGEHYEERSFTHHYFTDGCVRSHITRETAVAMLTKAGGSRLAKWYNLKVVGCVRPTGLIIPMGTVVMVSKPGSHKARLHTTTSVVPIPKTQGEPSVNTRKHTYTVWAGTQSPVVMFHYQGYEITVGIRDIESIV